MTRYSVPDEKNEESLEDVAMIDGDEKPIIKDITKASSDSSVQELIQTLASYLTCCNSAFKTKWIQMRTV